jgi:NAD(P)-dependent dehydrogenase (short-subunit alcohol dehydrogenase family)
MATMTTDPKTAAPTPPQPRQEQSPPGFTDELSPRPDHGEHSYRGCGKLKGRAAIITGADSGIGRAVAIAFAREGADVLISYLCEHGDAKETGRWVEEAGRRAVLVPGDVKDPDHCRQLVERAVDEFGKLDILVNNAAYQQEQKRFEDISLEQFDLTFKTNIYGYFSMVKAALPHLKKGSAIINTGSVAGLEGNKNLVDYAATKGAIHAFTKSLAQNLIGRGIRVNCVAPGPIWTPLQPVSKSPESVAEHGAGNPMGRPGQPEEVSPAFVFFASEADSSYVTGEVLTVNGADPSAA